MLRFRMGCVVSVALLFGACGRDAPPAAEPEPSPAAVANRALADFTAAVPMGSGTAAARLHFQLQERPVPGEPLTVKYRITPSAPVQKIQVVFEAEPGIRFVDELRTTLFVEGEATSAAGTHELQIIAASPGVMLLKATVLTENEAGSKSTDFAIPLIVPDAAAPPAPPPGG